MDLNKEREAYLAKLLEFNQITQDELNDLKYKIEINAFDSNYLSLRFVDKINFGWSTWQAAQKEVAPEEDHQIWATVNLTWKEVAFRALSCKILKTTENWVHVRNIVGVGSTSASLICRKLGVSPNGKKFELIESQDPAHD